MLTRSSIVKVLKFESQYGQSEGDFSPRWHAENPLPAHEVGQSVFGSQEVEGMQNDTAIQLAHTLDAQGNLRLTRVISDEKPLEAES